MDPNTQAILALSEATQHLLAHVAFTTSSPDVRSEANRLIANLSDSVGAMQAADAVLAGGGEIEPDEDPINEAPEES